GVIVPMSLDIRTLPHTYNGCLSAQATRLLRLRYAALIVRRSSVFEPSVFLRPCVCLFARGAQSAVISDLARGPCRGLCFQRSRHRFASHATLDYDQRHRMTFVEA